MNSRPLISVVMPSYNRGHWVGGAIGSLLAQETRGEFDYELIVVDNASSDDTAATVREAFNGAGIPSQYVLSTPPGDAPTRNAGIRRAAGQWIAFFDDDQLAPPQWLYELHAAALQCGGKIVGGPVHLDLTEEQLGNLGRLGRLTLREIDFYNQLQPYDGKHLPGTGNVLVERSLFDEVGLFDESMTQGGSDFQFFLAAREAGHELWYAPRAGIRHRIEPNRLTPAYHRWDSMAGAAQQAMADRRERGLGIAATSAIARMMQWSVVTAPAMMWAHVTGNRGEVFSRRIQAWRTLGYLRGALHAISPKVFAQREFFDSMNFRIGRDIGKEATGPTDPPGLTGVACVGGPTDPPGLTGVAAEHGLPAQQPSESADPSAHELQRLPAKETLE